jgi:hypothetical protein
LDKLADRKFSGVSAELRGNILDYYKNRKPPVFPPTKKAGKKWAKLQEELARLGQFQPQTAATP